MMMFPNAYFLMSMIIPISVYSVNVDIDMYLVFDLFPEPSQSCLDSINNTTHKTSYSFNYTPSSEEYWHPDTAQYEQMKFLAEIKSSPTSDDEGENNLNNTNTKNNNSWKIRIGHGGNIYSFESAFGQAVPPQAHQKAPFVDEVMQMVSVDQHQNRHSGKPYFIHQAGSYAKDGNYTKENPFYSPGVAKYCKDRSCAFASWPQQAHVPTFHRGVALYYTMYTDCGNGVIEFNQIMHNTETDEMDGDMLGYLNMPWGGPRRSTLNSFVQSYRDGRLIHRWPIHGWSRGFAENLSILGGATIFAQNVLLSDEKCKLDLPFKDGQHIRLIVANVKPHTTHSGWHTNKHHAYTVRTRILATGGTSDGRKNLRLWITNSRTGDKFTTRVLHWAWDRKWFYHLPEDMTAADINEMFSPGDEMLVSCVNDGKPFEENLALTHVYGFGGSNLFGSRWAPSRMRYGGTTYERDYTVWTINTRVRVEPGDTYLFRQYLMTGEVKDHQAQLDTWIDEAYEDIYYIGELTGHDLDLYYSSKKDIAVLTLSSDSSCENVPDTDVRCTGSTVPSYGKVPHFLITCGSGENATSYIGSNRYHFSPSRESETDIVRSYACDGEEDLSMRPTWKLLGYFEEGSCGVLQGIHILLEDSCNEDVFSPSTAPSKSSSFVPTDVLSVSPSTGVTAPPSGGFSSTPSNVQSSSPSALSSDSPTAIVSAEPSGKPSNVQSSSPSASTIVSAEPSGKQTSTTSLFTSDSPSSSSLSNVIATITTSVTNSSSTSVSSLGPTEESTSPPSKEISSAPPSHVPTSSRDINQLPSSPPTVSSNKESINPTTFTDYNSSEVPYFVGAVGENIVTSDSPPSSVLSYYCVFVPVLFVSIQISALC